MINNVQTQQTEKKKYDPLPDGSYSVRLSKAEVKETKLKDGYYLSCGFQIPEDAPEHAKRICWENFFISSSIPGKEKGVAAGTKNLSRMLKSIGVHGGFDALGRDASQVEQFIGRELIIEVELDLQENTEYDPRNKIVKFSRK